MPQRGRVSAAALSVVGGALRSRLAPPGDLADAERAYWLAAVNSRPADWFGTEHVPLLVNYCRHASRADVMAGLVADFKPEWLATDEGLKRYERLLKLARDESNALNQLARAMRLTHQSLYRADKAATTVANAAKSRPWEDGAEDEDDPQ